MTALVMMILVTCSINWVYVMLLTTDKSITKKWQYLVAIIPPIGLAWGLWVFFTRVLVNSFMSAKNDFSNLQ